MNLNYNCTGQLKMNDGSDFVINLLFFSWSYDKLHVNILNYN